MTSKFAASRRNRKTPAVCKKSGPPKPDLLPPGPGPNPMLQSLVLSTLYKRHDTAHPWHFSQTQRLHVESPYSWITNESFDPDFAFSFRLWFNPAHYYFHIWLTINHQGHADHHVNQVHSFPGTSLVFYFPALYLEVDNPALYFGRITLST